uniref:Uncharacterized protein n=1 Tax=Plectus sambesii TaxID=2011161 RepID=A0A914UKE0_9BILA
MGEAIEDAGIFTLAVGESFPAQRRKEQRQRWKRARRLALHKLMFFVVLRFFFGQLNYTDKRRITPAMYTQRDDNFAIIIIISINITIVVVVVIVVV